MLMEPPVDCAEALVRTSDMASTTWSRPHPRMRRGSSRRAADGQALASLYAGPSGDQRRLVRGDITDPGRHSETGLWSASAALGTARNVFSSLWRTAPQWLVLPSIPWI